MKKVAIYTTPTCTYCRQAKALFKEKGIAYEEYNVATDLARPEEMFTKSEQKGVPVITVAEADGSNEQVIIGYSREAVLETIGV